jgi:putative flippase GtrA
MADRANLTQMLRFVCVGVGAAVFFMLLTYALVSAGAPPFWASVLAYAICFVVAYLLQRFWTFDAKHAHREALPRYFVLQVTCAVISGLVAQVAIDHFAATRWVASGLAALTGGLLSYVGSTLFVFPSAPRPRPDPMPQGWGDSTAADNSALRREARPE